MIIDVEKFIREEQGDWTRLEAMLNRMERSPGERLSLDRTREFYALYQRASADLARLSTFSSEREVRVYLEALVARAYGEIHETRLRPHRLDIAGWTLRDLPRTFRKHVWAFWLSTGLMLAGALFGGGVVLLDPASKGELMPFSHLLGDPQDRVRQEESANRDRLQGVKGTFASQLMTHNIRVSFLILGLGASWGVGSAVVLFQNGMTLGAVIADYIRAGETKFLVGWLLPHGSLEIPAILIAGQAALLLGSILIGRKDRDPLKARFREAGKDLAMLVYGICLLLVLAGFIEAFLSQYHEPVIPYAGKISFGAVMLVLLTLYLSLAGRRRLPGEERTVARD